MQGSHDLCMEIVDTTIQAAVRVQTFVGFLVGFLVGCLVGFAVGRVGRAVAGGGGGGSGGNATALSCAAAVGHPVNGCPLQLHAESARECNATEMWTESRLMREYLSSGMHSAIFRRQLKTPRVPAGLWRCAGRCSMTRSYLRKSKQWTAKGFAIIYPQRLHVARQ